MRTMFTGFTGWASMRKTHNESLRTVDAAITVVATLGAAATYVLWHS